MNGHIRRGVHRCAAWLGLIVVLAATLAARAAPKSSATPPEAIIQAWPQASRDTALAMMAQYGKPRQYDADTLIWENNHPWRRTVLHRRAWQRGAGLRAMNHLEQTIGYRVPDNRLKALINFDPSMTINRAAGELTSRADNESMNYLGLNLAHEISIGARDARDARVFYTKTERLSRSGKSSLYLESFLFIPLNAGRQDLLPR